MNVVTARFLATAATAFSTASTSYVDHLNISGGSTLTVSITKGTGTNLIVDVNVDCIIFNTSNTVVFGVSDGTTDYDVCKARPTNSIFHGACGSKIITGLAAGTYTMKLRVKVVGNTYTFQNNNLGFASLTVREVDA